MDRIMNMTSTMSNWWGSSEKKDSKVVAADEIIDAAADDSKSDENGIATSEKIKAGAEEEGGEEEEASPPTSEADTPVSNKSQGFGGTTAGDDEGNDGGDDDGGGNDKPSAAAFGGGLQTGINEVSTKAIESAKNIGSFLFSVANKAGKTVTETAKQIKHTVEENSILGEFNKEQEAFVKEKNFQHSEAAVPPWVGYGEEDILKQQILSLSLDRRNFLRSPPSGVQYQFEFESMHPIALATLAEDPNLEKIRFELVPKLINEENFWKNYFYRVSLIKQSNQLSSLAQDTSSTGGDSSGHSSRKSSFDESKKGGRLSSVEDKGGDLNLQTADSPIHEFVSDSFPENIVDKEELRKGMQQLGMKGNADEEWEKEVQQELQEYEVVMEGKETNLADDPEWENEIQQMLDAIEISPETTNNQK